MNNTRTKLLLLFSVVLSVVLVACGRDTTDLVDEDGTGSDELLASEFVTASLEEQWEVVLTQAREEGEVNFETWCGNDSLNEWYATEVIPEMQEKYGITLNYNCNATNTFDRVLAGVTAGVEDANDVDWTNGDASFQMIESGLFYGPVAHRLPNYVKYVDSTASDLIVDFGYPNKGYEAPYARTQFTLFYNSDNVTDVPKNVEELKQWIINNPGRFTYPNPDVDFTGDAFLKTIFYATNSLGGHEPFLTGFDQTLLESAWEPTWDWFNEIKPYLWREGETYPETNGDIDVLYQNGEVDWIMAYGPTRGSSMIVDGLAPPSTRSLILEDGTVANANFLGIFVNAPNKAAAMVFLNHMLDPMTQLSWYQPENWGNLPTVSMDLIPNDIRDQFEATDRGVATPSLEDLVAHAKPEISSSYAEPLQQGWVEHVLK